MATLGRRWYRNIRPGRLGYPLDRAVVSPPGRFQVTYSERGTKAVVLADGRIVRELNRSFGHATDYD